VGVGVGDFKNMIAKGNFTFTISDLKMEEVIQVWRG
jgi:hypothetical protein